MGVALPSMQSDTHACECDGCAGAREARTAPRTPGEAWVVPQAPTPRTRIIPHRSVTVSIGGGPPATQARWSHVRTLQYVVFGLGHCGRVPSLSRCIIVDSAWGRRSPVRRPSVSAGRDAESRPYRLAAGEPRVSAGCSVESRDLVAGALATGCVMGVDTRLLSAARPWTRGKDQ